MPPRHQSHNVANRNRAVGRATATATLPINVSNPTNEDRSVWELDGRLTQVQEREVEFVVPHSVMDREAVDYEKYNDKVNQLGAMHAACVPIVTHNDPSSYFAAVNKRSNFIQASKSDDVGDLEFSDAKRVISELPSLYDMWDENDADRERWLAKFDDGKRSRMETAWSNLDGQTIKELRKKTGSVKIETLNGKRFDKTAAGRIIYAGTDAFNAVTGPAQMVMMERLVALCNTTYPSGKPVTFGNIQVKLCYKTDDIDLARFIIDDRYRTVVEGDFSRNDREQRSRVALIIDEMCDKIGMPQWYRTLLLALDVYTLTNVEFGLRVNLMYQLATGTTNTTFRNSVYNAVMFGVVSWRQKRQGKALILGDDILAALNKRLDLNEWIATVAAFKMVLKAKAPSMDGEATILSRRIFADVRVPFMVPLLGKMLVRFNARACQNPALSDSQAMAAKALSYAFSCKNCHVLRDIFLRRFEQEEASDIVDIESLGWNARQNGYTSADILRITKGAPNLVDDDEFSLWTSNVYDLDIVEVLELFESTVLCRDPIMLDDSRIYNMRKDFD